MQDNAWTWRNEISPFAIKGRRLPCRPGVSEAGLLGFELLTANRTLLNQALQTVQVPLGAIQIGVSAGQSRGDIGGIERCDQPTLGDGVPVIDREAGQDTWNAK